MDDLTALAAARRPGTGEAATPLVLPRVEFAKVAGRVSGRVRRDHRHAHRARRTDPFAGVDIAPGDLRRASNSTAEPSAAPARGLHRDGREADDGGGPGARVGPGLPALLRRMARLDGASIETPTALAQWAAARAGLDARIVSDVLAVANEPAPAVDAVRLFPGYLDTVEALLLIRDRPMARVLTLAALLLGASLGSAQPLPPELTAPVNDFAGVIDSATEARLETLIRQPRVGQRRRDRRRHGAHVPAVRRPARLRGQDVREPRPRHRGAQARTRAR